MTANVLNVGVAPSWMKKWSVVVAQVLLALVYLPGGWMKLTMEPALLAAQIPWATDVSEAFLRGIGMVDLAAGLGIWLPTLTRIAPQWTVRAAIGSCLLQICAMFFHGYRGEFGVIVMNLIIIALSVLVIIGRQRWVPVSPR